MEKLHAELFAAIGRFHKLPFMDLFPGMTKSDCMLLFAIGSCGCETGECVTVSDLVETVHTQNSAVSRTLKSLEEQGMIERSVNRMDRRTVYVTLTEKGREEQQRISRTMREIGSAVADQMNGEEIRQMTVWLSELYEIAEREIERVVLERKESSNGKDF